MSITVAFYIKYIILYTLLNFTQVIPLTYNVKMGHVCYLKIINTFKNNVCILKSKLSQRNSKMALEF